jgi:hypothetical protein
VDGDGTHDLLHEDIDADGVIDAIHEDLDADGVADLVRPIVFFFFNPHPQILIPTCFPNLVRINVLVSLLVSYAHPLTVSPGQAASHQQLRPRVRRGPVFLTRPPNPHTAQQHEGGLHPPFLTRFVPTFSQFL